MRIGYPFFHRAEARICGRLCQIRLGNDRRFCGPYTEMQPEGPCSLSEKTHRRAPAVRFSILEFVSPPDRCAAFGKRVLYGRLPFQRRPRRRVFLYLETVQGTPQLSYSARTTSTSSAAMGFMSSRV